LFSGAVQYSGTANGAWSKTLGGYPGEMVAARAVFPDNMVVGYVAFMVVA
jgi:hypothetical protein